MAFTVLIMNKDNIQRNLNQDIRLPLTQNTISMVLDAPVFGHGPGNFQKSFPEYASDSL